MNPGHRRGSLSAEARNGRRSRPKCLAPRSPRLAVRSESRATCRLTVRDHVPLPKAAPARKSLSPTAGPAAPSSSALTAWTETRTGPAYTLTAPDQAIPLDTATSRRTQQRAGTLNRVTSQPPPSAISETAQALIKFFAPAIAESLRCTARDLRDARRRVNAILPIADTAGPGTVRELTGCLRAVHRRITRIPRSAQGSISINSNAGQRVTSFTLDAAEVVEAAVDAASGIPADPDDAARRLARFTAAAGPLAYQADEIARYFRALAEGRAREEIAVAHRALGGAVVLGIDGLSGNRTASLADITAATGLPPEKIHGRPFTYTVITGPEDGTGDRPGTETLQWYQPARPGSPALASVISALARHPEFSGHDEIADALGISPADVTRILEPWQPPAARTPRPRPEPGAEPEPGQ